MAKRTSRLASNLLMSLIPKMRTWQQTKKLMEWNHWLMLKYGKFEQQKDGSWAFVEL